MGLAVAINKLILVKKLVLYSLEDPRVIIKDQQLVDLQIESVMFTLVMVEQLRKQTHIFYVQPLLLA